MAQEKDTLDIVEDEDLGGGITVTPTKPSRKIVGTDVDPIDELTGESIFDDIDSRFGDLAVQTELAPRKGADKEKDEEDVEEEPEEEEQEEAPEEEEEEEEVPRSSSFRKRLAREKRLREEAEANTRDLKHDIDELRAQITTKSSDEEFTRSQTDIDNKIAGVRAELVAAVEAGDSQKQADLTDKLVELRADKKANEITHASAKEITAQSKTTASRVVARKAEQWKRRHPRFKTDTEFAEVARGIDRALGREGIDPETDEFWKEMDKRVGKLYPSKKKQGDEDNEAEPGRRSKPPSQNARRETDGKRAMKMRGPFEVRGKSIYLSARQKANMEIFGMDPKNEADVREYIRNNS